MKKKYFEPEFDLLKFRFDAILDGRIKHSFPEDAAEGGEEGPES